MFGIGSSAQSIIHDASSLNNQRNFRKIISLSLTKLFKFLLTFVLRVEQNSVANQLNIFQHNAIKTTCVSILCGGD